MQCPVCGEALRTINRHEVEVDICPGCKGVWLDRGELEKILAYAATDGPPALDGAGIQGPPPPPRVDDLPPLQGRAPQPAYHDDRRQPARDDRDYDHHARKHDDDDDDDEHGGHGRRREYDRHGRPVRRKRGGWLGEILEGLGGD